MSRVAIGECRCRFPATARPRANPSPGMAPPSGGNAVGQISGVEDGGFARSARTQRSQARRRLVGGRLENGIIEKMDWVQYRAESVRHGASPSCRNRLRQGPACHPRTTASNVTVRPRRSARLYKLFAGSVLARVERSGCPSLICA